MPAVVGGVIGALAGGVPAYLIAARASRETAERQRQDQVNSELATLQSAFIKLLEITNGYFTICSQINEMLYNAHAKGHKEWELWQKVLPMVGFDNHSHVRFDSKEIALFMKDDENSDFTNELCLIDKRYAAFNASVRDYSIRRETLSGMLPANEIINGVGTTELDKIAAGKAIPLAYTLNSMAENIIKTMHSDRRMATSLTEEFGPRAKKLFPDRKVPSFRMA